VTFTAAATLETLRMCNWRMEAGGTSGQEIAANLSSPIGAILRQCPAASMAGLN
jgi:hypothetical protein